MQMKTDLNSSQKPHELDIKLFDECEIPEIIAHFWTPIKPHACQTYTYKLQPESHYASLVEIDVTHIHLYGMSNSEY